MNRTEEAIEEVITTYIKKEFLAEEPQLVLENDLRLLDEGFIDSLGIFLLIGHIEREFGVKIMQNDVTIANFETVNAIKSLVMTKLAANR